MVVTLFNPSIVIVPDPAPVEGPWRSLRILEPNHPKDASGLYKQTCTLDISFEGDKKLFAFVQKLNAAVDKYRRDVAA